ncbi:MAG: hypothetical protein WCF24_04820 [Acidimicrobiales bacterium]
MTESWRLKFRRAETHFSGLQEQIGIPIGRQPYRVTEILNTDGSYEYRLFFPPLPETISLVVGDMLFNVRSSLDHLFCAFIPGDDKGRAQFPIFVHDPFEVDQSTGKYMRPWAYGAWKKQTEGVPDPVLEVVWQLQPFHQALLRPGARSSNHTLNVLRTLQDVDKHSQLTFLGPVLNKTEVTVEGYGTFGIVPGYHDGSLIHDSPNKVNVHVEGEVGIPFGVRRDEGWEYPMTFQMILRFVSDEVFPALEPML